MGGLEADISADEVYARPARDLRLVPFQSEDGTDSELGRALSTSKAQRSASHVGWVHSYQRTLFVADFLAAGVAAASALIMRFGASADWSGLYLAFGIGFPFLWVAVIAGNRGYGATEIGSGPEEFQRVGRTFLQLVTAIAIVSYALKADLSRGLVFVALPGALGLDLMLRYALRRRTHRLRKRGEAMSSVLVVGSPARVAALTADLRRDLYAGLRVVAACVPEPEADLDGMARLARLGVAHVGGLDDIRNLVEAIGADIVAVTASEEIGPEKLRWISWQLEGTKAELAVSPGLIDVAGTRISVRQAAGLPLLYVEAPRFTGPHRVIKGAFDRVIAGSALLILSPVVVAVAAFVRVGSHGPAFFRQTRVGKDGKTFTMIKFRSMYSDAEARLDELAEQNDNADGLLFKMRDDPRVTPVGKFLRRYSLDELPQLINVFTGSMSLVGPRPPLPREVGQYGDDVRRRLLVKPGLTGLWQVSGRSDLSWEDSVRLDLRYVENWSLAMDMMLLWKTARAVLGANGAY
jgi:exopolysaccharide biosynthesis polyprenyl glycosylphosphotransferase